MAGAGAALTTAVLAGVGIGIAADPASAVPTSSSIVFTGGTAGVLVCASEPSSSTMTIQAGSKITFVNRLGQAGDLKISGQTVASVPNDQAVPVTFHAGPVSVSMTFPCSLAPKVTFRAVTVTVDPAPVVTTPAPAPTTASAVVPPPGAGNGIGATSGAGTGAGANAPHNAAPVNGTRPAAITVPPRTAGPTTAAGTAVRPGPPVAPDGVAVGAAPSTGLGADLPTGVSPSTPEVFAVGPLEPARGTPTSDPAGLLGLLAGVCAAGVTIAAFRVILLQRAIRTRRA